MSKGWFLILFMLLLRCGQLSDEVTPTAEVAPDFTMQTLTGDAVTLSAQDGWTLVNFWATWCAPCIAEMPYLQQLSDEGDVTVWGINMRESAAEIEQFTAEYNITFPVLLNPTDETILAYRGNLPRTYAVYDGKLMHTFYGSIDEKIFDTWWNSVQP